MDKWANYCVSAVSYDRNNSHIVKLMVHVDNGDTIGAGVEWSRSAVVDYIEKGYTFITITKKDGKWVKGASIEVITFNPKYLRTDKDRTEKDNLGQLPII